MNKAFFEAKVMEVWMVQDGVFLFQYLGFQAGKNWPSALNQLGESPAILCNFCSAGFCFESGKIGG